MTGPSNKLLVSRPAYGEGDAALPKGDERVAESGLPGGGPSNKGLPLDNGIPGTSTHDQDEKTVRESDKAKDESIYRTDNADDFLTNQSRIPVRDDNADKHDGIGAFGKGESDERSPKTKYPYRDDHSNTMYASSKLVVESWLADQSHTFRVRAGSRVKIALRLSEITDGLNPKFKERGDRCSVSLKRADTGNLRWIFAVQCNAEPRIVKVKGFRSGNVTKLTKMDLDMSCSCPAWRWLGPEYHSKTEDYLDGKPRGTASVPVIRDPSGVNRVCKHVSAVLDHVQAWDVAKKKKR